MNVKRFKLIADGLLKLHDFDFAVVVKNINKSTLPALDCGAICCAIGAIPILDPDSNIKWFVGKSGICDVESDELTSFKNIAAEYFGISEHDAGYLFAPSYQSKIENWGNFPVCNYNATASEVRDAMYHYCKINEVEL